MWSALADTSIINPTIVSIATTIPPFGLTLPCVVSITNDASMNLPTSLAYFGFAEGKYQ